MSDLRRHIPLLTLAVVVATTIGAAAQLADPVVFQALRRDQAALGAGEWWRVVSPLLVLDGNLWLHYAADTVVLVVVGTTFEQQVGRRAWAVLFAAGALVGQLFGYAWDPGGAGASVAICGLVGGLVVVQLIDRELHLAASLFCVGLAAALASAAVATRLGGHGVVASIIVVVSCAILINVVMLLRRSSTGREITLWFVAGVVAVGALALLVQQDIHGPALLVGIAVGLLLFGGSARGNARDGHPDDGDGDA